MMAMERKRVYGELGTLYAQCGGIFGVAAFVDRCMDKWMADPVLNGNQAVVTWHAKAQRCGFKFLVVQIVGQLTGGPQRYTGRPMDEAHKHLNITESEWDKFLELFNEVCGEFQLPGDVIGDLNALMISMEFDCVVQPGEPVPPNPGPAQLRGSSLYARCGGVYPLALFVDRLVDALLEDERVRIPYDHQKRTEVSLKYLFTELVCSIAGGPEVITSRDYDETKLLLPMAAWEIFISTAQVASDHIAACLRAELVQALQRAKSFIVDPHNDEALPHQMLGRSGGAMCAKVKDIQSAAAGKMLSSAAIAARHAAPGAHVGARRRVMGDPRTLYGRGGGVFGLAKLADRLMDAWMEDQSLNENAAVAKWHESQQKYGFKFLVTQLFGYLTGGPQRYTGVPMEAAHKHLAISLAQWQSFIADAEGVFQELGIDANTHAELQSILASFKDQCTLGHGEVAPADPGLCRSRPQGSSAYAQLGGVYPIALFAHRLVDAVLAGDRLQVQWNSLDDEAGVRHPPGLKYMVTELLCHGAGGPEKVTSKGYDDAKLGIDPEQWLSFMGLVAETAAVWPTQHHRDLVLKICERSKAEICFGLEGQDVPAVELPHFMPDEAISVAACCPVSGKSGQCPFSGTRAAAPPEAYSLSASDQECSSVHFSSHLQSAQAVPMAGRVLGSIMQQKLDELMDEDPDLCCPISLMVLVDPAIASDGFVYEKAMLMQLIHNKQRSPMTREVLKSQFRAASEKKAEVMNFRQCRSQELIAFAQEAVASQSTMALAALGRITDYVEPLVAAEAQGIATAAMQLYAQLGQPAPPPVQRLAGDCP